MHEINVWLGVAISPTSLSKYDVEGRKNFLQYTDYTIEYAKKLLEEKKKKISHSKNLFYEPMNLISSNDAITSPEVQVTLNVLLRIFARLA